MKSRKGKFNLYIKSWSEPNSIYVLQKYQLISVSMYCNEVIYFVVKYNIIILFVGDLVSQISKVRIHSTEEDNLSPFD